ncbi:rod shape-determining protein MreC [Stella humosa]|uniref:Cell shape-determining protein MreC n=1 Tax=Stella humosa TaxID=94 RepID=A0A3N1L7T5_9PROT|nr:rod shape-determining protein MreC [Stella humosa]ROP90723.1 rod shape-determining protein MreC [Stella humosa]BBK29377.1 cell shape-determining protein MreC [Stella humosa]
MRSQSPLRLTMPIRAWMQRFALLLLILAAFGLIVLGKADTVVVERLRIQLADTVAPLLDLISRPAASFGRMSEEVREITALKAENERLREANGRLLQWQEVARRLEAENLQLRVLMNVTPEPSLSYVSARIIADSGGAFVRSVLVNAGGRSGAARGQAAVADRGLVGRVVEVGDRSSRILLLTDLNSRIPVLLEGSRERAVLAGDNGPRPRLLYMPAKREAAPGGDRVITSGHGGVFPPGIPVGETVAGEDGVVRVIPYADFDRLEFLRLVDTGLAHTLTEPIPGPQRARGRPRP